MLICILRLMDLMRGFRTKGRCVMNISTAPILSGYTETKLFDGSDGHSGYPTYGPFSARATGTRHRN